MGEKDHPRPHRDSEEETDGGGGFTYPRSEGSPTEERGDEGEGGFHAVWMVTVRS